MRWDVALSRALRRFCHPPSTAFLVPFLLSLLLFPSPSLAAISSSDLLTYLGGTATGQSFSIPTGDNPYTLTVVANDSAVLVSASFEGKKASEVGWVGWGVGSTMTDADLVVCWPTVSGDSLTWTLSHRTATSTVMPTLVGTANADDPSVDSTGALKIVASLSSASGGESPAVVTWERKLQMEDGYEGGQNYQLEAKINQQFIFAYGEDNPGDSAQDTDFRQHALDSMGGAYVDLSAAFAESTEPIEPPITPLKESEGGKGGEGSSKTATATGGGAGASKTKTGGTAEETGTSGGGEGGGEESEGGGGGAASNTGSASGSTSTGGSSSSSSSSGSTSTTSGEKGGLSYSTVILIHGVCAGASWAVLAPMGVLFARYARGPPGTTLTRFPWHFSMQGWIVTPLTLAAVGLAVFAVSLKTSSSTQPFAHKTVGFVFLGGLVLQDLLGLIKHFCKTPGASPQRGLLGWLHIMLGVTLIVVGFFQVKLGIERYGASNTVLYGLYACTALFSLAYIGSLVATLMSTAPQPSPSSSSAPRRSSSHHSRRPRSSSHKHHSTHRRHPRPSSGSRSERRSWEKKKRRRKRWKEEERDEESSASTYDSEDSLYSDEGDSMGSSSDDEEKSRRGRRRRR